MKKNIINFSILMLLTFMAHGMINTQSIPYLTQIGYDSIERGYIMSFYAVVAVLGQFVAGYLSDKYKSVKRFFIYSTFVLIVTSFLTFTLQDKNFLVHLILMGNTIGFIRIIGNLLETWIIEVDGLYPYFGSIRSLGSVGWAVSSLLSGIIIVNKGYTFMLWVSLLLNVLVVFFSFRLEDANKSTDTKVNLSDVKALFLNKRYVLLLIVYCFVYVVYNADNVSVTDLMLTMGATEGDIGQKWFVQAVLELPMLFMGAYFIRRFGAKKLMIFGSFMLGLRFVLYALFPSPNSVILISSLQGLSFPFLLMTQKELVLKETPAAVRSTGQMVSVALTSGFSAIISPIISGYLGAYFAIQWVVMGFGLAMLIPMGLMLFYKDVSIT